MRVRAGLPFGVHAMAGMLDRGRRLAETAVGLDGQCGDAAGIIIRHQETFARGIHGEMTGSAAAGGLLIQQA